MRTFTAVVERDADTSLYDGYIPGFPGAHSQAETLDELQTNLREVIAMLLEEGEPNIEAEFVGIQSSSREVVVLLEGLGRTNSFGTRMAAPRLFPSMPVVISHQSSCEGLRLISASRSINCSDGAEKRERS
jgi:predicted RNase H-like HicB family nuclease